MKRAFKTFYNYLLALIGVGLVSLVAILPYFCLADSNMWPKNYIAYTYLFGGVVLLGVGFIWQDLFRGLQRKKLNNWDTNLPQEIVDKAWRIFAPFFMSAILSVLTGAILCIVFK